MRGGALGRALGRRREREDAREREREEERAQLHRKTLALNQARLAAFFQALRPQPRPQPCPRPSALPSALSPQSCPTLPSAFIRALPSAFIRASAFIPARPASAPSSMARWWWKGGAAAAEHQGGGGTVRRNCWFCAGDVDVRAPRAAAPEQTPSWTCPRCGSYNGFTPDGDYDRPIGRCATSDGAPAAPAYADRGLFQAADVLCDTCNHHQRLIVALLASFEPTSEVRPSPPDAGSAAISSVLRAWSAPPHERNAGDRAGGGTGVPQAAGRAVPPVRRVRGRGGAPPRAASPLVPDDMDCSHAQVEQGGAPDAGPFGCVRSRAHGAACALISVASASMGGRWSAGGISLGGCCSRCACSPWPSPTWPHSPATSMVLCSLTRTRGALPGTHVCSTTPSPFSWHSRMP